MSPGIVAESDLSGNLKSEYVFFDGERVARKDFPGNSIFYYFSDHLKTASVITDSAGNTKEDEDYYPWGGELQFVNNDSNHYKFGGHERDNETGLDYYGARYYGNWVGRFLTPDWAAKPTTIPYAKFGNPQTLNLYTYAGNNPITLGDADGHCDGPTSCAVAFTGWLAGRVAAQGSVKAVAKDSAIGASKGGGTWVVNTVKAAVAGGQMFGGNPVGGAMTLITPNPKALQPSNQTQADVSKATQVGLTVTSVAVPLAAASAPTSGTATLTEGAQTLTEGVIFRSGGTNPSNISGADLSFRNSLSNPIDAADNPVFSPGDKYFGVDVSKLPEGSAVLDNNPAGHVTVNAPTEAIKDAVVVKGKLPKTDPQ